MYMEFCSKGPQIAKSLSRCYVVFHLHINDFIVMPLNFLIIFFLFAIIAHKNSLLNISFIFCFPRRVIWQGCNVHTPSMPSSLVLITTHHDTQCTPLLSPLLRRNCSWLVQFHQQFQSEGKCLKSICGCGWSYTHYKHWFSNKRQLQGCIPQFANNSLH